MPSSHHNLALIDIRSPNLLAPSRIRKSQTIRWPPNVTDDKFAEENHDDDLPVLVPQNYAKNR